MGNDFPIRMLDCDGLGAIISALQSQGCAVMGPTIRDGAIMYGEIDSLEDLPQGWTDDQEKGFYRLKRRNDQAYFGYNVGPDAWKRLLHHPEVKLFSSQRQNGKIQFTEHPPHPRKLAFLGVRSCELHALSIQDQVFQDGPYVDAHYEAHRKQVFIIAANCTQSARTCFCTSMGTGPEARQGFDLAITEVLADQEHLFVVQAGSRAGSDLLRHVPHRPVEDSLAEKAKALTQHAADTISRRLDADHIRETLLGQLDSPRWKDIADRCLSCGNCTMVCPTCFCTTVEDRSDIDGETATRLRRWDSCFTGDFTYLHGQPVRPSIRARYRQWITHKLATWHDQFGRSGCVGCGRCIAWCPVGIDITEEANHFQLDAVATSTPPGPQAHED